MSSAKGFTQIGEASWYGRKFHGRLTSNGERYDMFKLTAAHKNLPLPTYVRVTNLENGKSTVVRVNDRGPFHGERIIDLSYAAAVKIDAVSNITEVRVEALNPSASVTASVAQAWRPSAELVSDRVRNSDRQAFVAGAHLLQVGSYSSASNAREMGRELVRIGIQDVFVRRANIRAGQVVHRVVVGPFKRGEAYEQARTRLIEAGYAPIRINN